LKLSVATVGSWPYPGVREPQLLGRPPRTAGFRQGDRRREDPQSTRCWRTTRRCRCPLR